MMFGCFFPVSCQLVPMLYYALLLKDTYTYLLLTVLYGRYPSTIQTINNTLFRGTKETVVDSDKQLTLK